MLLCKHAKLLCYSMCVFMNKMFKPNTTHKHLHVSFFLPLTEMFRDRLTRELTTVNVTQRILGGLWKAQVPSWLYCSSQQACNRNSRHFSIIKMWVLFLLILSYTTDYGVQYYFPAEQNGWKSDFLSLELFPVRKWLKCHNHIFNKNKNSKKDKNSFHQISAKVLR